MKTVKLLKQHVIKDGEHTVTNHPGAVIDLPADEADTLILDGGAEEYTPPEQHAAAEEVASSAAPAADTSVADPAADLG